MFLLLFFFLLLFSPNVIFSLFTNSFCLMCCMYITAAPITTTSTITNTTTCMYLFFILIIFHMFFYFVCAFSSLLSKPHSLLSFTSFFYLYLFSLHILVLLFHQTSKFYSAYQRRPPGLHPPRPLMHIAYSPDFPNNYKFPLLAFNLRFLLPSILTMMHLRI